MEFSTFYTFLFFIFIILHNLWPNRVTAVITLTGLLAMQFYNGIYHLVGTCYFGEFSPGLVTGLILFIPLSYFFILKAYRESYINKTSMHMINYHYKY